MSEDIVRVQRTRTRTMKTGNYPTDYYRTYLNIPKYIREQMKLSGKSIVYLSKRTDSSLFLLRTRKYIDDEKLILTEIITRKYNGNNYTALRLTIPVLICQIMNINESYNAKFSYYSKRCVIEFKNRQNSS